MQRLCFFLVSLFSALTVRSSPILVAEALVVTLVSEITVSDLQGQQAIYVLDTSSMILAQSIYDRMGDRESRSKLRDLFRSVHASVKLPKVFTELQLDFGRPNSTQTTIDTTEGCFDNRFSDQQSTVRHTYESKMAMEFSPAFTLTWSAILLGYSGGVGVTTMHLTTVDCVVPARGQLQLQRQSLLSKVHVSKSREVKIVLVRGEEEIVFGPWEEASVPALELESTEVACVMDPELIQC